MRRSRGLVGVALAGVLTVACGRSEKHRAGQTAAVGTSGHVAAADVGPALQTTPAFVTRDREGQHLWALTRQFYQRRDDAPAWIENGKPRPQLKQLIAALEQAGREGLDPALYNPQALAVFDRGQALERDVRLTYTYLQYATDLSSGVGNLSRAHKDWQIKGSRADVVALLDQALDDNDVGDSLAGLLPSHPQYTKLRDALQQYRDIARRGGWPQLPSSLTLKPGAHSDQIPLLAQRLAATGDFSGRVADGDTTYTPELQEAVKRFQRRHGLADTATVAAATVAQMNVPVERRIEQIALNLERWRWLPRELGERHILVNIPEYRLEVWDHGTVPLSMRVVVGKKDTPTPIFNDNMTFVVFAPYWNVPADIVRKETIPSVMKDPAFLDKTNMEVLDRSGNVVDAASVDLDNPGAYRFRQRPGGRNSLGSVKFMFPNQFNVYLHDTPADSLFARAARSFSHGCVRVGQPGQLAEYVLRDQPEWTTDRIREAMNGRQEKTVKLREPLPVYLGYWTARVSADGILQFRDDLYGIDAHQQALLGSTLTALKAHAEVAAPAVAASRDAER
jgi:murein L,D-transpeptidase YcbB/YkuD